METATLVFAIIILIYLTIVMWNVGLILEEVRAIRKLLNRPSMITTNKKMSETDLLMLKDSFLTKQIPTVVVDKTKPFDKNLLVDQQPCPYCHQGSRLSICMYCRESIMNTHNPVSCLWVHSTTGKEQCQTYIKRFAKPEPA